MKDAVFRTILNKKQAGEPGFAVLIDPDEYPSDSFDYMMDQLLFAPPDYVFVGGSLLTKNALSDCLQQLKETIDIPILLFPGDTIQIDGQADAILFLSLLSGRNSELLIGQQVRAAPLVRDEDIEPIATAYLLVDGGRATTAHYMSQTMPLPADKPEIAANTALAGAFLGMQCIYLDTGSGAERAVSSEMIRTVREQVELPLIVGGGIRKEEQARTAVEAGADIIVVGTALQEDPSRLHRMRNALKFSENTN